MVELPFHLILFQILILIDTKSIHRFKLEMLQDQGLFISSSVLMELWPRELIELYGLHDQHASEENLNVIEEMVVIENGERTIYQVYDDDT
ncbi:hypothetical protein Hanom_Chr17g01546831 [Helianthus anomalus]